MNVIHLDRKYMNWPLLVRMQGFMNVIHSSSEEMNLV